MCVGDLVCYVHDRDCVGIILNMHEPSGDATVLWSDIVEEKYNTTRRIWEVEEHNVEVVSQLRVTGT